MQLAVVSQTADTVAVQDTGLDGNEPATHDAIAVWPASGIPWSTPPALTLPVTSDASAGTLTITGLAVESTAYVLGYLTGTTVSTLAAGAQVAPGANPLVPVTQLELLGAFPRGSVFTAGYCTGPAATELAATVSFSS